MIKIIVDGQSLRWYDRAPKVAADSVEFVKFKFLLSEEWDNHVVVAQFSQKGATYNKVLEDGCCTLPVEIEDGKCFISIFGQIPGGPERATVIPLLTDVSLSGFVGNGETPIPPTPDLYSQLIDYFSKNSSGGAGAVSPEDIAQAVENYLAEHPIESPDLTEQVEQAELAARRAENANTSAQSALSGAAGAASDASNYAKQAQGFANSASGSAGFANTRANEASAAATAAENAATRAEEAVANLPESGGSLEISGATVGQMVVIKAVDENGMPTAWEAADVPDEGVMLTGAGVPATVIAPLGALYMDTDTQEVYKCIKVVDGTCAWAKFNAALEEQLENKLDADKLTEAVEDALTQAKESGEFDGDDYVLTEDDKLEIAEQVSKLSGGNANQGLSTTASALLITVLRNGVYSVDQSDNITALAAELGVTESEEDTHSHSYTSVVTTAATCTTAGVRTYTCSCGESYTEEIPATGHNYVDGVCTVCGAVDPDYSEDVTLSSISATYSGGDVAVGTAVSDLTGIVVTAGYSDGSTKTVTGYTLSGEIAEGSNTVTVSYGGKTTTFTVTGVAESGGDSDIPADATRLAYIESSGTQYIDTGAQVHWNNELSMSADTSAISTSCYLFGANDGTCTVFLNPYRNTTVTKVSWPGKESNGTNTDFAKDNLGFDVCHRIISGNADSGYVDFGNVTLYIGDAERVGAVANLYLFANNNNGTASGFASYKLKEFILYTDYTRETEIIHLLPVLDPDGIVCLYDTVSKQYFYNAGTGDFVGGEAA